jgi:alkanesulfonate monooxygenase SsuD/methylene tetrahydromethanopterin reductase-like flavin-dependent oxidoreductase (luciferase family)
VHDIVDLEARGIPSVMVASQEFVAAAAAQARALGADPARVFVRHPIQDRTDAEMRSLADEAVDDILRSLIARQTTAL